MVAWLGLKADMQHVQTEKIDLKGDSPTTMAWINGETIPTDPAIWNIKPVI